jgi:electron transfer flavoprotein alpha subunit
LAESGVATVLQASQEPDLPEACAHAIADLVRSEGIGLVLMGATPRGRDLGARVAGYLDCGFAADAAQVAYDGQTVTYERTIYGGNVISREHIDGMAVATVGRGCAERVSGTALIKTVDLAADTRVTLVARNPVQTEGVDLGSAERVVGVGMGVSSEDEVALANQMADAMGGAVGCSRGMAEERKWVPVERYIGISGKVISPSLYLMLGISGQVQHLFGVRDAKIIAAVDKNENAPVFKNADYGIVGDLHEIMPLLLDAVRAR